MRLISTAAFGLEASVKREVVALGFADVTCVDNRVEFSPRAGEGMGMAIARANLWLRCADRALIKLGAFTATTFDALFEQTKYI